MRFDNRIVNFGDTHVTRHLTDDQLMETYVLAGDNRHLAVCRPCKARFDELVRSLQQMHDAAVREADSAFTADRLHDQRDRIMRRIERHDHPAEVVAFPHQRVPVASDAVHRLLGPGAPLGRGRRGGRSRRRAVPRLRDGPAAAICAPSISAVQQSNRTRRGAAGRAPTISSSSRSTRRSSARARARCAPI